MLEMGGMADGSQSRLWEMTLVNDGVGSAVALVAEMKHLPRTLPVTFDNTQHD